MQTGKEKFRRARRITGIFSSTDKYHILDISAANSSKVLYTTEMKAFIPGF